MGVTVITMALTGKAAIITGAGKGIGRGIARAYAAEGARLVLVSRTLAQVEDAAEEARASGSEASALAVDVASPDDVRRMVDHTLELYSRIDVLVNNAAVLGPVGPLHLNDAEHWAQAININVTGLMLCCHAVLPHMIEQGGGKIINLSGAGVTRASETISAYGTSKAAVVRFTETLALEMLPHNVSVNALGPGQIDTELLDPMAGDDSLIEPIMGAMVRRTKSGRGAPLEEPLEEAAALAVWLASNASDGLSGRLISATQEDWRELGPRIPQVMASDQYTLRFNA